MSGMDFVCFFNQRTVRTGGRGELRVRVVLTAWTGPMAEGRAVAQRNAKSRGSCWNVKRREEGLRRQRREPAAHRSPSPVGYLAFTLVAPRRQLVFPVLFNGCN